MTRDHLIRLPFFSCITGVFCSHCHKYGRQFEKVPHQNPHLRWQSRIFSCSETFHFRAFRHAALEWHSSWSGFARNFLVVFLRLVMTALRWIFRWPQGKIDGFWRCALPVYFSNDNLSLFLDMAKNRFFRRAVIIIKDLSVLEKRPSLPQSISRKGFIVDNSILEPCFFAVFGARVVMRNRMRTLIVFWFK